jgi:chromosomal replication initiation ATPase DnaA
VTTLATITDVVEAVSRASGRSAELLLSKDRHRSVSTWRQLAMWLCRQRLIPQPTLEEVGEAFSGRDHTSVMNACQKIDARMEMRDRETMILLRAVESQLGTFIDELDTEPLGPVEPAEPTEPVDPADPP